MSLLNANDLHAARLAARGATYPNAEAERAATDRIDRDTFDKVRSYELTTARSAQDFADRCGESANEAAELIGELRYNFRAGLEQGDIPADATSSRRYEQLRRDAESRASALRAAAQHARWRADKCADPYGNYVDMIRKFPALQGRS